MRSKKFVLRVVLVSLFILAIGGVIWLRHSTLLGRADVSNNVEKSSLIVQGLNKEIIDLKNANINLKDKGKTSTKITDKAKRRKTEMTSLLQKSPEQFLSLAMPSNLRESLPEDSKQYIEREVNVEGIFDIKEFDNFDQKISMEEYYLTDTNGKKYQLFSSKQNQTLLPRTTVKISGVMVDDKIAANSYGSQDPVQTNQSQVLAASSTAAGSPVSGVRKVAVLLINFQENGAVQPFTPEFVQERMFTPGISVNQYYQTVSFNKLKFSGNLNPDGDVFGWYTISNPRVNCDYHGYSDAARQQATNAGIDLTVYDNMVYLIDDSPYCTFGGITTMGGSEAWILNTASIWPRYVAHELGHDFWLGHATSYFCLDSNFQNVPFGSPNVARCSSSEYGDPFDIMGKPLYSLYYHLNNYSKGLAGWLNQNNIQEVTDRTSGIYTIFPIESASEGVQVLKIPQYINVLTGNPDIYYFLEYRQTLYPFENFKSTEPVVNGITIRRAPVGGVYSPVSQLIGLGIYGDPWKQPLQVGQTFTDQTSNITFQTISATSSNATINVTFGPEPCTKRMPMVKINPVSGSAVKPGTPFSYTITVTNNNTQTCPPATFTFYTQYIWSPWGLTYLPSSLTLPSGSTASSKLTVTSPANAANGSTWGKACVNNPDPNATNCSDYFAYWVDNVNGDTKAPMGMISVNPMSSDASSYLPTTNLTITASDEGAAGVDSYQLMNSDGPVGSPNWQVGVATDWMDWPGASSYVYTNWDMTSHGASTNPGIKTVYVRFKDRAGNISQAYSASYTYNLAPVEVFLYRPILGLENFIGDVRT